MFKIVLSIVAAALLVAPSTATVYNRCSFAQTMSSLGVPRDQLARWACIAQHESDYNTRAVGPPNSDGSRDYGIFQINNLYWCQPSNGAFSYNECQTSCDAFLVDNIEPNLRCAQLVLQQQGWTAWSTWKYCDGSLPSIDDCF